MFREPSSLRGVGGGGGGVLSTHLMGVREPPRQASPAQWVGAEGLTQ